MLQRFHHWRSGWLQRPASLARAYGQEGLKSTASLLTGLVFPPECALCESAVPMDCRLCGECLNQLVCVRYCCQRCAMPLPSVIPNDQCIHCRKAGWKFSRVIALGPYRGKLREAVIICKKVKRDSLRYALSEQLADRIRERLPLIGQQQPMLIPVPNHWSRAFSGVAPTAASLASMLGRQTGWPVANGIARRIRKTSKQGMLSIHERKLNMRGAFKKIGTQSLTGRHVLIVDDVLTSGATANELARQIARGGPSDISVIVVARAIGR